MKFVIMAVSKVTVTFGTRLDKNKRKYRNQKKKFWSS